MNVRERESRKGRRYSAEERQQLVKQFRQRTGTLKEFSQEHEVSLHSLYKWTRDPSKKVGVPSRQRRPTLQELVVPAGLGGWANEVRMPDGTLVRWNRGCDVAALMEVLHQLRQPC